MEQNLITGQVRELKLEEFPSPEVLYQRYRMDKNIDEAEEKVILEPYYYTPNYKMPRYYQRVAINRAVDAVAKGQNRVLLVSATGTGKTFTTFQIIYRLWKSGLKKKILFLADRNVLVDQTITGDNDEGKAQLENFIDEESPYPVIAVTSKLMTTGVDAKMCKLIVLENNINSMTEFKQIIGRGTRLLEDYGKTYFTIMDFRNASRLFADPAFDGKPEVVIDLKGDDPVDEPETPIDEEATIDDTGNDGVRQDDGEYRIGDTPAFDDEGTAKELIEKIEAEKKKLIKEGKLKKQKALPEIKEDEIPFDTPESWEWVRLEQVCEYIQRGKSPKYSDIQKYPVVAQKCNQWSGFSLEKAKFIDPKTIGSYKEERILQEGDLMWNSTGLGTLGRVAIYQENKNPYELAVADSHVTVIRLLKHHVNFKYLYYYIANPSVQSVIEKQSSGSTKQIELATSTVKNYIVPLPPLNEQKRIVEEIEELLPYCRKLAK